MFVLKKKLHCIVNVLCCVLTLSYIFDKKFDKNKINFDLKYCKFRS